MDMSLQKDEDKAEEEQHRIWTNYLSLIFSNKPDPNEPARNKQAREKFAESIRPKEKQDKGPAKVYDWDFERLKLIQQKQEGG